MARRSSEPSIPQDGLVDLDTMDVAANPRRRRRVRNRPAPAEELIEWEKGAARRLNARPYPPNIILEPAGMDKEHWTSPHSDVALWTLQLADAFATRSRAVMATFMSQLQSLCGRDFWDEEAKQWRLDENEFSAIIAIVNSIKPRNELEAALAVQMVGVHLMTMKTMARAISEHWDTRNAAIAAKLARTFAIQMEALRVNRMKSRTSKQSIKVRKELHQHVHYHDDRGAGKNDGQPCGRRAAPDDQRPALPCAEQSGESVSLPSHEGQGEVSDTRRR